MTIAQNITPERMRDRLYWESPELYGAVSHQDFQAPEGEEASLTESALESAIASGKLVIGSRWYNINNMTATTPLRLQEVKINCDQSNVNTLLVQNAEDTIQRVDLVNCEFTQPNSYISGGLGNDYHCLKLRGVWDAHLQNIRVDGDLGISILFGLPDLDERRSCDNRIFGARGYDLRGMGLELFGNQYGSYYGVSMHGDDGEGGRAVYHGLRLGSYDFATNDFNIIDVHADHFANGASVQHYSRHNHVRMSAHDCTIGIGLHGVGESVPLANLSKFNQFTANIRDCGYGIYDGASYNTFIVNVEDCTTAGILQVANGGTDGFSKGSTYIGRVVNTVGRLCELRGDRDSFDLQLIGIDTTDTTYGLLIVGNYNQGSCIVHACGAGVYISGNNNRCESIITSCTTALTITGNDNATQVSTDGTVTISGNRNSVQGHATRLVLTSAEKCHADLSLVAASDVNAVLLSGVEDNECLNNLVDVTATGALNAVSVQRFARNNTVRVKAIGCTNAVGVQGSDSSVPIDEVSYGNRFEITAAACAYAVADGGSMNDFHVVADGCTSGGILQVVNGGTAGLSRGSRFTGIIRNTAGRLCELRGDRNTFDLELHGIDTTATVYALLIPGDYNVGRAVIDTCNAGCWITGDYNRVQAVVTNSTQPFNVTGDSNVIEIYTTGNATISGNNNIIRGHIGGTITNTGTGNDILVNGTAQITGNVTLGDVSLHVAGSVDNVSIGTATHGAGDGTKCLTISEGVAPTATTANTFVVYADQVGSITGAPHFRCADGNTMKLYRNANMTAADATAVDSGHEATDDVIDNLRTRVGELEQILKNLGVLA